MFCIDSDTGNPYFNLALEEMLLKESIEEYAILSVNRNAVIIGKHQTAHREINTRFITENNIPVIRRITGGGTVFHDQGNLNFTFIKQSEPGKQVNFKEYTLPVIDFLSSVGISAKFEGKNDLKVNGLKISGNAEHVHHNRVLHHGTLLFNTTLDTLRNCLRKDVSCYNSRAVMSNPSQVINLGEIISGIKDISDFRSRMMNHFLGFFPGAEIYKLSEDEKMKIRSLATSKYMTWEWNYAYGPEYHFNHNFEFLDQHISCRLYVREGIIRDCILGGSDSLVHVADRFKGCRHMPEDLMEALRKDGLEDLNVFNFF